MNIYVGNLAWKTRRQELQELFENFGEVTNTFIVRDKATRRSRGFGFVEMAVEQEAREAIEKLNQTVFLDRTIIVNEARPKEEDPGEQEIAHSDEQEGVDFGEQGFLHSEDPENIDCEKREAADSGEQEVANSKEQDNIHSGDGPGDSRGKDVL